jgi:uncharacterized membrane protein YczE
LAFRKKLQLLLVLLVGVSCDLLLWLSLRKANRLTFELIQEKVYSIAVSTAPQIDGDIVENLHHTFPLEMVDEGSLEFVLFRVTMPLPTFG